MRFPVVPVLALVALATACGGDDDDDGGDATQAPVANTVSATQDAASDSTVASTQPAAPTTATQSGGDANPSNGVAPNTAVVIIDGQRYEFTLTQCLSMAGALAGGGKSSDGSDVRINIQVPPQGGLEDTLPYIRVDDVEKNLDWRAGGEVVDTLQGYEEGVSQVDEYSNDGSQASGTATFIELYRALGGDFTSVDGTFEFACD